MALSRLFGRGQGTAEDGPDKTKVVEPPVPSIPAESPADRRFRQCERLLGAAVIDLDRICEIAWAGIPRQFRPTVWRLFLDYEPVNQALKGQTLTHKRLDYFDCLERVFSEGQRHLWTTAQRATQTQILRDLPRSPLTLLRSSRVKDLFERVLFVWAVRHPASGYVQGMNDLLAPFFFVFLSPFLPNETIDEIGSHEDITCVSDSDLKEIEADCFWCFSKLLDGLQDLYTRDQPGLHKMLVQLKDTITLVDPALAKWISTEEIEYQAFAFRWMNCLLVREFPLDLVLRLWDSYMSGHARIPTTHIYVCAALMTTLSSKLVGLSHADFVVTVQQLSSNDWKMEEVEMILAQAYVYEKRFGPKRASQRP